MKALADKMLVLIILLVSIAAICPASGRSNESYYITIYPIGDHAVGEIITISGTTNLPVNTTLWVSAGPRIFTKYPPNYYDDWISVIPGTNGNLWSATMNTSLSTIDEYYVLVQPLINDPPFSSATFNITPRNIHPPKMTEVSRTTLNKETMPPASLASSPQVTIHSSSARITAAAIPEYLPIVALIFLGILAGLFRT